MERFTAIITSGFSGNRIELEQEMRLGYDRKNKYIDKVNSEKQNVLCNSQKSNARAKGVLRNVFRDMVYSDEDLENVINELKLDWANESNSLYLQIPSHNYTPEIQDKTSKQEKERILGPSVIKINEFLQERGMDASEDLIDRIVVVSENVFDFFLMQEIGRDHQLDSNLFVTGMTLANRFCLINHDKVLDIAEIEKVSYEQALRETCIHELWHSVSYMERWVIEGNKSDNFLKADLKRRDGIFTNHPKISNFGGQNDAVYNILFSLKEGFTQYLTRDSLRKADEDSNTTAYKEELRIVDRIINEIGISPFIAATFSKEGFLVLSKALKKKYSKEYGEKNTYETLLLQAFSEFA